MQTVDLDQVEQWIAGDGEPPDRDELKAFAIELGAERTRLRQQVDEAGKLVRALAVLLFKMGDTNQAALRRDLGLSVMTLHNDLTAAGFPAAKHTRGTGADHEAA